jgi:aspartate aminotransferase
MAEFYNASDKITMKVLFVDWWYSPMKELASRVGDLGTESAFEVLARAKEIESTGKKVLHLEIGEPDFPTPPHIVDAAIRALHDGYTHYVPAPGLIQTRQAVAEFYLEKRGISVDPSTVVITPGAKPIMFFTMLALCDPGDEVIYPDPGFPMYESIARLVGAKPVPIPLREHLSFRIDIDELKSLVSPKTKLVILNSPHNPTGSILTKEELKEIARLANEYDFYILSDEVYWAISYSTQKVPSMLEFDEARQKTILLDGWSKAFAMTGWRLGFGIFPSRLVEPITRLVINSVSCTSAFSQIAGIAALKGPWSAVEEMVETFATRRKVIVEGLNNIPGISCVMPDGAFYVFPNVTGTGIDSVTLQKKLLDEFGVACLSGTAFGKYGQGYLRLSYAASLQTIEEALCLIEKAVKK